MPHSNASYSLKSELLLTRSLVRGFLSCRHDYRSLRVSKVEYQSRCHDRRQRQIQHASEERIRLRVNISDYIRPCESSEVSDRIDQPDRGCCRSAREKRRRQGPERRQVAIQTSRSHTEHSYRQDRIVLSNGAKQ